MKQTVWQPYKDVVKPRHTGTGPLQAWRVAARPVSPPVAEATCPHGIPPEIWEATKSLTSKLDTISTTIQFSYQLDAIGYNSPVDIDTLTRSTDQAKRDIDTICHYLTVPTAEHDQTIIALNTLKASICNPIRIGYSTTEIIKTFKEAQAVFKDTRTTDLRQLLSPLLGSDWTPKILDINFERSVSPTNQIFRYELMWENSAGTQCKLNTFKSLDIVYQIPDIKAKKLILEGKTTKDVVHLLMTIPDDLRSLLRESPDKTAKQKVRLVKSLTFLLELFRKSESQHVSPVVELLQHCLKFANEDSQVNMSKPIVASLCNLVLLVIASPSFDSKHPLYEQCTELLPELEHRLAPIVHDLLSLCPKQ